MVGAMMTLMHLRGACAQGQGQLLMTKTVALLRRINWLTGGLGLAVIGTIIFLLLPTEIQDMHEITWYTGWFIIPAFFLFAFFCIILRIDFISNRPESAGYNPAEAVWIGSIFVVLFLVGALIGWLIEKVLTVRRGKQE